jgi:hypothetical protein
MEKKHTHRDDHAAKSPVTHRATKLEETALDRPEKSTKHQPGENHNVGQDARKDHR